MTYYFSIDSSNLPFYFSCACIKPACFFPERELDIQNKVPYAILLSTILGTIDTNCSLEIVLTKEEEIKLQRIDLNWFAYNTPLPISRVKKIYFRDIKHQERTITNINLSTAFVPSNLPDIAKFSDIEFLNNNVHLQNSADNVEKKIKLYDSILGSLALMKLAKEEYMNYSETYASTLSFFNSEIRNDLLRQHVNIKDRFFGLFTKQAPFDKLLPYLERKVNYEDLEFVAKANNQTIQKSVTKKINFDNLKGLPYVLAVLISYGTGNESAKQKIDSLIINNFKGLKEDTEEGIALYYGYNRGYTVFGNSYGTASSNNQIVKFLLNSKLDYYIIESIYQFVFNNGCISGNFEYLDNWCPNRHESPRKKNDYVVLDTVFHGKKKPSVFSKEYFLGLLEEVKAFDLNSPISALIDILRTKVASDTKEEIDEQNEEKIASCNASWEEKFQRANADAKQLKQDIEDQNEIISRLQEENAKLLKQVESSSASVRVSNTDALASYDLPAGDNELREPKPSYEAPEESIAQGNVTPPTVVDGYHEPQKPTSKGSRKSASTKSGTTSKNGKPTKKSKPVEEEPKPATVNTETEEKGKAESEGKPAECGTLDFNYND